MKKEFKIGDVIVVTGSTITADANKFEINRALCEVLAVGHYDLFVKKLKRYEYSYGTLYPFRVSKERCVSIDERIGNELAEIVKPRLGDLVLSYSSSGDFKEKNKTQSFKIGFLIEIADIPGTSKTCKILSGEDVFKAPYDSLIVFEKTKK